MPVVLFIALDTFSLYRQTLAAVTTAYDRTLLASAKSIGGHIDAQGHDELAKLSAVVPYSALEALRRRTTAAAWSTAYRKSMAAWSTALPTCGCGAARFPAWALCGIGGLHDDTFRGDPVRWRCLLQPVASEQGRAMAVVQVAETLELRRALAPDSG
ncbi:MAG: sensor histidine kinase N-terminal domain-containing protein [Rhodoferax sp.]|nr:sensor histidine kinase N-terminal domain-containing protein [Rhodoferax sp.]